MTDRHTRLARTINYEWDRAFLASLPDLTPEEQAEIRAAADRKEQEKAERFAEQRRARDDRYGALLDRCSGVLATVVRHHSPGDWDECSGCDQSPGCQDEAAAWPCSTFLMIEADLPAVETP